MSAVQLKLKLDGLTNVLTGQGIHGYDPTLATQVKATSYLPREIADELYRSSGICRKVVDTYPDAMTSEWGEVNFGGDKADTALKIELTDFLDNIPVTTMFHSGTGIRYAFNWCQTQANLHGNAAAIMLFENDDDLSQPLPKVPNRLIGLHLLDRYQCYPQLNNLGLLRQITHYQIASDVAGGTVHRDRVLWFRGAELSNRLLARNQGCDDSLLMLIFDAYISLQTGIQNAHRMMINSGQRMHGITGLLEKLETLGTEYEEFLRQRIALNEIGASVYRTAIYDKDLESIEFLERSNLNGVKDILEVFIDYIVANSDLTRGQLLGEYAGGILTAGSEAERSQINQAVAMKQAKKFGHLIQRFIRLILRSKLFRKPDQQFSWHWFPYLKRTEDEIINQRGQIISQASQLNAVYPALAYNLLASSFSTPELNTNLILDARVAKMLDLEITEAQQSLLEEIRQAKLEREQAQQELEKPEVPEFQ